MGLKAGWRGYLRNAPPEAVEAMELPELDMGERLSGAFDYIHLFATTQADLDRQFPELRDHLSATGKLWVSWPKGRQLDSDLTLPIVIRIGYSHGLVESTTLSLDAIWSAIRFTRPKAGKTYNNSYGTLPDR